MAACRQKTVGQPKTITTTITITTIAAAAAEAAEGWWSDLLLSRP
jgi:hypothetical protein